MKNSNQSRPTIFWAAVSMATWLGSRIFLMECTYPKPLGYAVVLLTLVPFSLFLWQFFKIIRHGDELERQVQLEALALAFPLTVLGLMKLSLFQMIAPLSIENWSYRHLLPFVFVAYFVGLFLARRRYGIHGNKSENDN